MRELLSSAPPCEYPRTAHLSNSDFAMTASRSAASAGTSYGREFAALPVAAKVGDLHTKSALQKGDKGTEHFAGGHYPVQQQQGLTLAYNLEEYAVRCARFCGMWQPSRHFA
jgi:hypothetical protein